MSDFIHAGYVDGNGRWRRIEKDASEFGLPIGETRVLVRLFVVRFSKCGISLCVAHPRIL